MLPSPSVVRYRSQVKDIKLPPYTLTGVIVFKTPLFFNLQSYSSQGSAVPTYLS